MNQNELYHFGIKGMKWGVRRYQNSDGTLTSAGQKRYDRDVAVNAGKKKDNRIPESGLKDPNRWVKEDRTRARGLVDATYRLNNDLKNANRDSMNRAKNNRSKMDLSNMTDKEMRDQINRAVLERQYNDMFAPQKVSRGREFASNVLNVAGSALAVTSSALGVALAIQQLKNGG